MAGGVNVRKKKKEEEVPQKGDREDKKGKGDREFLKVTKSVGMGRPEVISNNTMKKKPESPKKMPNAAPKITPGPFPRPPLKITPGPMPPPSGEKPRIKPKQAEPPKNFQSKGSQNPPKSPKTYKEEPAAVASRAMSAYDRMMKNSVERGTASEAVRRKYGKGR